MQSTLEQQNTQKLASFAGNATFSKINDYATTAAFSWMPTSFLVSGGYRPNIPLNYFVRAFTAFFCLNDIGGQAINRYLLGERDRKLNELAAKLGISRTQALGLLIEPGQTLVATMQKIEYRPIPGVNSTRYLTVPFIVSTLQCSVDEALLMLATKESEKSKKGTALGLFFSKLEVPRLAFNTLTAWTIEYFAYAAFSDTTSNEPSASEQTHQYQWMLVALINCISLKWISEQLTQRIDNWRLQDFLNSLDAAHSAYFNIELQRPAIRNRYQVMLDDQAATITTIAIRKI